MSSSFMYDLRLFSSMIGLTKPITSIKYKDKIIWSTMSPADAGFHEKILEKAANDLSSSFVNINSLLIIKEGSLILEKYYNGMKPVVGKSIKSITKGIISALVGIALEEGYISSLDIKVPEFFPEYAGAINNHYNDVTLRHLLTMTSGTDIDENSNEMLRIWSGDNWVRDILSLSRKNKPGETFKYTTTDTHLISAIISKVVKRNLLDYASEKLFEPIGIKSRLHWEKDPQGNYWGGNNLFLTPRMLATIGQLYLQKGKWNTIQLIPEAWIDQSTKMQSEGREGEGSYGYLWWVSSNPQVQYYFASGFGGQFICILPKHEMVIVMTANPYISINEYDESENALMKKPDYLITNYILPTIN